ncbi:hypothetical protein D3C81_1134690 [compost metagenome]
MDFIDRELRFNVKGPNAFDIITKEFDAVGKVVRERKNIYDTSSYCKLSGFIDKIYTFEIIFDQKLIDKINT